MEDEKSVVEEATEIVAEAVEDVVEVSMNPEDWEAQTNFATEDITDASLEAVEVTPEAGGDINEAND